MLCPVCGHEHHTLMEISQGAYLSFFRCNRCHSIWT
jgi:hypothetical protein